MAAYTNVIYTTCPNESGPASEFDKCLNGQNGNYTE